MTGLIDWTTGASIGQSIGPCNRWRLARLARKPRRCNMPLATAAVEGKAPINPNQQEQNTLGRPKTRPDRCPAAIMKLGFLFPPTPRYIQKESEKRARKRYGQLDRPRPGRRDPPRGRIPHRQQPPPTPPPPLLRLSSPHPTCSFMAVFLVARLKKNSFSLGASDTVPYMKRN